MTRGGGDERSERQPGLAWGCRVFPCNLQPKVAKCTPGAFESLAEMVIRELTRSVEGSVHAYKYRLYYGFPGRRLVGYDNERGKGDHRHIDDKETRYAFSSVERLI